MKPGELAELCREQRLVVAALKATSKRMKERACIAVVPPSFARPILLLTMAEGLIEAHKAAKIDDDGYTLDLIEDAMRHVGKRLAKEHGVDANFDRRRLDPV